MEKNEMNRLGDIVQPLLTWYDKNARVLPWRENTDPYRIWVSEIMLQQTQVETVIPFYNRFLQQLPNIKSLAEAEEAQLMKLWEGLGYYSRARNLQKAAQMIMTKHKGRFPETYDEILALPGIGKYTAGAISSICYGMPIPAVDGNVLRVIARLTGYSEDISTPAVKENFSVKLSEIYPKARTGDFTQSLMELGAIVCLPKTSPKCGECPINALCKAYYTGTQAVLPVKAKTKAKQISQKTIFLLSCGNKIAVRQREPGVLLGGLWEFPNTDGHLSQEQAEVFLDQWGVSVCLIKEGVRRKHVFTHVIWDMVSYIVTCDTMTPDILWVTKEKLVEDMALPTAFRPFSNLV